MFSRAGTWGSKAPPRFPRPPATWLPRRQAKPSTPWQRKALIALIAVIGLLALYESGSLFGGVRVRMAESHAKSLLQRAREASHKLKEQGVDQSMYTCFDPGSHTEGAAACAPAREFLARLRAAGLTMPTPTMDSDFVLSNACDGGCFVAGNLRNAQAVMPNYILQLVTAAAALAEKGNKLFVSIYESGSNDLTTGWLQVLGDALDALGVRHALVLNGDITRKKGEERIEFLARVRHAALEPLYTLCHESGVFCVNTTGTDTTTTNGGTTTTSATALAASISPPPTAGAGRIVFLNDVLYSYTDILRLVQYPAHLVCGLDLGMAAYPDLTPLEHQDTIESYLRGAWHLSPGLAHTLSRSRLLAHRWRRLHQFHEPDLRAYGPLFFYDKWVARDISGRMFSNRPPFVGFPPDILRVTAGKPVRAHCCWNGLAILTAAPFLAKKMRFRQHEPGECSASECSLVCDDLWRQGYGDVIVDPNVRVTYDEPGARRLYKDFTSQLPIGVPWVTYTPFKRSDVAEVMALPKHADLSRDSGAGAVGQGAGAGAGAGVGGFAARWPGAILRQVDCCDLAPGADMVEFRDPGVCHNATVPLYA